MILRLDRPCAVCGATALIVELVPRGVPHPRDAGDLASLGVLDGSAEGPAGTLVVEGISRAAFALHEPVDALRAALEAGNLPALDNLDPEYAPTWCPDCDATYCRSHWTQQVVMDEGFYDCTYGTCPEGHQRIVDD